jgi:hypothetical protein
VYTDFVAKAETNRTENKMYIEYSVLNVAELQSAIDDIIAEAAVEGQAAVKPAEMRLAHPLWICAATTDDGKIAVEVTA